MNVNDPPPLEFSHWLTARFGRWCVAPRITDRLRAKGYDAAISQATYRDYAKEFIATHQAIAT